MPARSGSELPFENRIHARYVAPGTKAPWASAGGRSGSTRNSARTQPWAFGWASRRAGRTPSDVDPTLGGALGRVLRGALDRFERPLREHLGDAYVLTLWRHSSEITEMHGEDRPAQDLLTRAFAGAEDLDPARPPRPTA